MFLLIKDELSLDVGSAQKGGRDCRDVSPVPLGSKEFRNPPTLKSDRLLRAKSLHCIMNEHKMSEIKV
ncbi:hypothetical protein MetMK1DRAFT_00013360 [Metallosphaera yellowstonensis MK1]|jgi:hypothetical protein|uniref:Uncharacterized protein n=1 Tax=Metallosphaera yellowstonensis MK1 TaxID=671065 RepID=H2C3L1_9CREN|nr:hypothetical protein [Metallosphaera yellowstonensis]EHP70832.1 hypothetical protein MetMK1DRAFT_00013360 [Metallosphaera yellowstonensis MK1]